MDAMQKFLEYTSAYDDGSDTRIKLKIIHTQRVTEVMEQLTAATHFRKVTESWRICVRYITISEDLSS